MASFSHNNRTCICCGEKFRYCSSCKEFANLPTWYAMFHNENCKNLFEITSDLTDGVINEKEAKEAFEKCDLSYKNKLHKNIINAINQVNVNNKKHENKNEEVK